MADLVDLEDMQFYLCQISRFSCLLKNLGEPIISYTDRLFHSQQAITRNAPTILRQIFLRNRILVFVTFKFDNMPSMIKQPGTHQKIARNQPRFQSKRPNQLYFQPLTVLRDHPFRKLAFLKVRLNEFMKLSIP